MHASPLPCSFSFGLLGRCLLGLCFATFHRKQREHSGSHVLCREGWNP